ncbi:cache domain-containing protein [Desulforhopalus sp. IMCC35007]|uniref:cache domain-containing protein n=1 Tax=Desulforhopalus sp. IMCC35007 TaxID=2569543 RepID=UPI001F0E0802|nr:cache domain-containing protein [Desulforhopalus sp. IMCC35007]
MKLKLLNLIYSTRFRLIASLLVVSLLIGTLSLIVGGNMLYSSVLTETRTRVREDLNVAKLLYDERIDAIRMVLEIIADTSEFKQALASGNYLYLDKQIQNFSGRVGLNFAGIINDNNESYGRLNQQVVGQVTQAVMNPLVVRAFTEVRSIAGTFVMDEQSLRYENPELLIKAQIATSENLPAQKDLKSAVAQGLAVGAAVPVRLDGKVIGAVYGGVLLNGDTSFVDQVGETVFRNEVYKGRNVGTSTIFLNAQRISTNVMNRNGERALGTYASSEVTRQVLDEGKLWTDRAQVLSDWYISAYEPIMDIFDTRVGMLYVGTLEDKYLDVRKQAIVLFALITLAGIVFSFVLGWYVTGIIMKPVNGLLQASVAISNGNFSPDIGPPSKCDMGLLQEQFKIMTEALQEREKRQKEESESVLIQSEKHASVGKLAAGVAHEINNPLTAVLTFTHLILRRQDLAAEVRDDLETIASQTERVRKIVKSLLDFSRQSRLDPQPMDLNLELAKSVKLLSNQSLIKGVELSFNGATGLPMFSLDRNLCQSVWINMIMNALDATQPGDKIEVSTQQVISDDKNGAEIIIRDTGSGIEPEILDKLFDPFFTTKDVGKGTGLGLAVSAGIIERHEGNIRVTSTLEEGTCFTIWLPAIRLLGDHCSYPTKYLRRGA